MSPPVQLVVVGDPAGDNADALESTLADLLRAHNIVLVQPGIVIADADADADDGTDDAQAPVYAQMSNLPAGRGRGEPTAAELASGAAGVVAVLRELRPRIVLAAGTLAAKLLFAGLQPRAMKRIGNLGSLRTRVYPFSGLQFTCSLVATLPIAAVLHQAAHAETISADIALVRRFLDGAVHLSPHPLDTPARNAAERDRTAKRTQGTLDMFLGRAAAAKNSAPDGTPEDAPAGAPPPKRARDLRGAQVQRATPVAGLWPAGAAGPGSWGPNSRAAADEQGANVV